MQIKKCKLARDVKTKRRKMDWPKGLRVFSGFVTFQMTIWTWIAGKGLPSECNKIILYAFSDAELREISVMNCTGILVMRTLKTQVFIRLRSSLIATHFETATVRNLLTEVIIMPFDRWEHPKRATTISCHEWLNAGNTNRCHNSLKLARLTSSQTW